MFLGEAILTVVYLINKIPTSHSSAFSQFEKLNGNVPNYSSLHVFGCTCFFLQAHILSIQNYIMSLHCVSFWVIELLKRNIVLSIRPVKKFVSSHIVFLEHILFFSIPNSHIIWHSQISFVLILFISSLKMIHPRIMILWFSRHAPLMTPFLRPLNLVLRFWMILPCVGLLMFIPLLNFPTFIILLIHIFLYLLSLHTVFRSLCPLERLLLILSGRLLWLMNLHLYTILKNKIWYYYCTLRAIGFHWVYKIKTKFYGLLEWY